MLFTRAGLEQATRLADRRAARGALPRCRHRRASPTSAAGSAATRSGSPRSGCAVEAVDADEVTAAIAAYNLAPFGDSRDACSHGTAEEYVRVADAASGPSVDAVWLDPARRTAGHTETSRTRPEDWSPSLDWAFDLAARVPTGIKLGPGPRPRR